MDVSYLFSINYHREHKSNVAIRCLNKISQLLKNTNFGEGTEFKKTI